MRNEDIKVIDFKDQSGGVSEIGFSKEQKAKARKIKKRSERAYEESVSDSIINDLSADPMFEVLKHYLISTKGNKLVDILDDIKDHLAAIRDMFKK